MRRERAGNKKQLKYFRGAKFSEHIVAFMRLLFIGCAVAIGIYLQFA